MFIFLNGSGTYTQRIKPI